MRINKLNGLQACSITILTLLINLQMAEANTIVESFDKQYNGKLNSFDNMSPNAGTATLTLNADGTVTADVVSTTDYIIGIGFSRTLSATVFSTNNVFFESSYWAGAYGNPASSTLGNYTGVIDPSRFYTKEVIITIGTLGEFTDASQVLATDQPSPIWLYVLGTEQYGTDLLSSSTSAVPEPSTLWLFGAGFTGLMGYIRRKFPQAS